MRRQPFEVVGALRLGALRGKPVPLSDLATRETPPPRSQSGLEEFDRVLGGGLVPASAILVGGDPGIGKSTLLLQAAASFARKGLKCIYVSGEEASSQVRMRAQRLGLADAPVRLATETNLRNRAPRPRHHRLGADDVGRQRGVRARLGQPGARRGA